MSAGLEAEYGDGSLGAAAAESGSAPSVLVLGAGNLLLKDDGVGIHVLRRLEKLELPGEVTLLDAGTGIHRLLEEFSRFDRLIVLDCVQAGAEPGAVFRFRPEDVRESRGVTTSLHQMGLLEILEMARLLDRLPETVIIGIQPGDASPWGEELTPEVEARLDRVVQIVLEELQACAAAPGRSGHA